MRHLHPDEDGSARSSGQGPLPMGGCSPSSHEHYFRALGQDPLGRQVAPHNEHLLRSGCFPRVPLARDRAHGPRPRDAVRVGANCLHGQELSRAAPRPVGGSREPGRHDATRSGTPTVTCSSATRTSSPTRPATRRRVSHLGTRVRLRMLPGLCARAPRLRRHSSFGRRRHEIDLERVPSGRTARGAVNRRAVGHPDDGRQADLLAATVLTYRFPVKHFTHPRRTPAVLRGFDSRPLLRHAGLGRLSRGSGAGAASRVGAEALRAKDYLDTAQSIHSPRRDGARVVARQPLWARAATCGPASDRERLTLGFSVYKSTTVVIIGDRCKIQNHVSRLPRTGDRGQVFVVPSAVFTNDLYPPR